MTEKEGDGEEFPALLTVEEFASRVILASVSVIFMTLFLLGLLQVQLVSIVLPAKYFGVFLTIVIIIIIGYITPKLYRYGALIFGSYWAMARREDLNVERHSALKTTGFFIGFTIFGAVAIYFINRIWLDTIEAPDQRLLSIIRGNPEALTLIEVFLLELATAGAVAFFAAAGYTVLYRIKLRFFPNYYCPLCAKQIKRDYRVCPYCEGEITEPVTRRPYYRVPFGAEEE